MLSRLRFTAARCARPRKPSVARGSGSRIDHDGKLVAAQGGGWVGGCCCCARSMHGLFWANRSSLSLARNRGGASPPTRRISCNGPRHPSPCSRRTDGVKLLRDASRIFTKASGGWRSQGFSSGCACICTALQIEHWRHCRLALLYRFSAI
ncbi:hypothetical protein BKA80DRAFT_112560 [Phyllosticta citrichinensis]